MNPWWDVQTAVWIGALGGGGLGTLGGLLGAVAGALAPRGIGKPLVVGGFFLLTLIGAASLVTGVVAVVQSQPYHVFYPLLLGGAVLSLVGGPLTYVVRHRYHQAEQRRLNAQEFRRG